jgi:hypothetical protein
VPDADVANGTRGTQAYRWLVTVGMALIAGLSWRVLEQVDRMALKLESLQIQVTTIAGQYANADRRNDRQDQQIDELQRRVWRAP